MEPKAEKPEAKHQLESNPNLTSKSKVLQSKWVKDVFINMFRFDRSQCLNMLFLAKMSHNTTFD